jgi:hypothetical protein
MAHFAQINEDNIVLGVNVISNDVLDPENTGTEDEALGIAFCKSLWGDDTNWVQTSYNNNFRKQFAGINFWYDATNDVFISKQPFDSWTLGDNYVTADQIDEWKPPTPHPDPTQYDQYWWHEPSQTWVNQE